MTSSSGCLVQAPAKVNLYLGVGGLRDDGFHHVDTLFQAVSLWDHVRLERVASGVTLTVLGPDLGPVEDNLAVRAARLFLGEVASREGVALELTKDIPAGAGLGGGSSDAAAVLRGMNHLWGRPVPPRRLAEMGASLGSDVAFFLGDSPLSRGRGRGEILEPYPALPPADMVLVLPPVHVATPGAYAALSRHRAGGAAWASKVREHGPPAGWTEVKVMARNDFEEVVSLEHPAVRRSLAALRNAGGGPTLLSGSGAACFGVFADEGAAQAVAARLAVELGWPARAVRTLTEFPVPGLPDPPGT